MNNEAFLLTVNNSFQIYLKTGARSNEKLKVLHGFIAKILSEKLGESYKIVSLGFGSGKERNIQGRYIDKSVDITVLKDDKVVAGIAVKFVMSNYAQNSNNYFESMLGETSNIRCSSIPYFQILILSQNAPYFNKGGTISKLEEITKNNLHKYAVLSKDDTNIYLHSPDKTLIYIVKTKSNNSNFIGKSKENYFDSLMGSSKFETCVVDGIEFGSNVILNDFDQYIEKIAYRIKSI